MDDAVAHEVAMCLGPWQQYRQYFGCRLEVQFAQLFDV